MASLYDEMEAAIKSNNIGLFRELVEEDNNFYSWIHRLSSNKDVISVNLCNIMNGCLRTDLIKNKKILDHVVEPKTVNQEIILNAINEANLEDLVTGMDYEKDVYDLLLCDAKKYGRTKIFDIIKNFSIVGGNSENNSPVYREIKLKMHQDLIKFLLADQFPT